MLRLSFTAPSDTDGDGLFDEKGGKGRRVKLKTDPTRDTRDRHHRLLAYARVSGGLQLNRSQVARGWPKVYVYRRKRFQQYRSFRQAQRSAKSAGRGVWEQCGGDFHRP
jgi:endonuclease YncB( thermonuclease family)